MEGMWCDGVPLCCLEGSETHRWRDISWLAWCWKGGRSCFCGLAAPFKSRETAPLPQMEIKSLLMSGAVAWKTLFPSEINIYCKSTVCSGSRLWSQDLSGDCLCAGCSWR